MTPQAIENGRLAALIVASIASWAFGVLCGAAIAVGIIGNQPPVLDNRPHAFHPEPPTSLPRAAAPILR